VALVAIDLHTNDVTHLIQQKFLYSEYLSTPTTFQSPTGTEGHVAYANYYPPTNKDYIGIGESPPLLIQIHGGPTGSFSASLNLNFQYFTSRGFAVCDVNYRGSTGYGRKYRQLLNGKWGIYDVEDASCAAAFLAKEGKADKNRLTISGGSAGGYTALAALAFSTVFKGGASRYGVSDLTALTKETHKFESHYLDQLIGPYPADEQIYKDRSPINHIDKFNSPLLILQGDEDKVVPLNQALILFNTLKDKGLPVAIEIFKGEQHGFRKAENIQKAIDGEFGFYSRVFGFHPADVLPPLDIKNADKLQKNIIGVKVNCYYVG